MYYTKSTLSTDKTMNTNIRIIFVFIYITNDTQFNCNKQVLILFLNYYMKNRSKNVKTVNYIHRPIIN